MLYGLAYRRVLADNVESIISGNGPAYAVLGVVSPGVDGEVAGAFY